MLFQFATRRHCHHSVKPVHKWRPADRKEAGPLIFFFLPMSHAINEVISNFGDTSHFRFRRVSCVRVLFPASDMV